RPLLARDGAPPVLTARRVGGASGSLRRGRASSHLEPQTRLRGAVPGPRLPVPDLGARLLELSLRELDDPGEPQLLAAAGEVERRVRLLEQLRGHVEPGPRRAGVEPGRLDVPHDLVPELEEALTRRLRLERGLLGARAEEKSVEDGDLDVDADGAVPRRDGV